MNDVNIIAEMIPNIDIWVFPDAKPRMTNIQAIASDSKKGTLVNFIVNDSKSLLRRTQLNHPFPSGTGITGRTGMASALGCIS